jgi:hypothetical protein
VQTIKLLIMWFSLHSPVTSSLYNSEYPPQHTKNTVKRNADLLSTSHTFKIIYRKQERKRELV